MADTATPLTKGRGWAYVLAAGAGLLALAGYADFDPQTWVIDIHPFNLKEFFLTGATTAGNVLAGLAVWRGWGKQSETVT